MGNLHRMKLTAAWGLARRRHGEGVREWTACLEKDAAGDGSVGRGRRYLEQADGLQNAQGCSVAPEKKSQVRCSILETCSTLMGQAVPHTSRTFTRKPNARQRSSAKKTWTPLVEDTLQDDSDGADSKVCSAAEAGFCDSSNFGSMGPTARPSRPPSKTQQPVWLRKGKMVAGVGTAHAKR